MTMPFTYQKKQIRQWPLWLHHFYISQIFFSILMHERGLNQMPYQSYSTQLDLIKWGEHPHKTNVLTSWANHTALCLRFFFLIYTARVWTSFAIELFCVIYTISASGFIRIVFGTTHRKSQVCESFKYNITSKTELLWEFLWTLILPTKVLTVMEIED